MNICYGNTFGDAKGIYWPKAGSVWVYGNTIADPPRDYSW